MNKELEVCLKDESIEIRMNTELLLSFEISKNKINGKVLFDALKVERDDVFTLKPSNVIKDSKVVSDIVVTNTHEFIDNVIKRINSKLIEVNI